MPSNFLRNYFSRSILSLGLAGLLTGCGEEGREVEKKEGSLSSGEHSFTNFGYHFIHKVHSENIATGDFDGDGDIDIAITDYSGNLIIYENKIPQKR